jgi:hypothetical protein
MSAIEQEILELIRTIEELSPEVWAIYLKQQIVSGCTNLLASLAILIPTLYGACRCIKFIMSEKFDTGADLPFIPMMVLVLGLPTLLGLSVATEAVSKLINPEYYAIQDLKEF